MLKRKPGTDTKMANKLDRTVSQRSTSDTNCLITDHGESERLTWDLGHCPGGPRHKK